MWLLHLVQPSRGTELVKTCFAVYYIFMYSKYIKIYIMINSSNNLFIIYMYVYDPFRQNICNSCPEDTNEYLWHITLKNVYVLVVAGKTQMMCVQMCIYDDISYSAVADTSISSITARYSMRTHSRIYYSWYDYHEGGRRLGWLLIGDRAVVGSITI